MKKVFIILLLLAVTISSFAGYGRGGRSGGFRSSYTRSYSAPRYSYSRPSYRSSPSVIHEVHHVGSGGGFGSHIMAFMAGNMMAERQQQPVYVQPAAPVQQEVPVAPMAPMAPTQNPSDTASFLSIAFWGLLLLVSVAGLIRYISRRV